jgi:hypothetical protein
MLAYIGMCGVDPDASCKQGQFFDLIVRRIWRVRSQGPILKTGHGDCAELRGLYLSIAASGRLLDDRKTDVE